MRGLSGTREDHRDLNDLWGGIYMGKVSMQDLMHARLDGRINNPQTTWRSGWERRGMRNASGDPVKNQHLVKRLWEELDKRPSLIRLQWVKGHAGDEGNEIVDALANSAAEAVRAGGRPVDKVNRKLAA